MSAVGATRLCLDVRDHGEYWRVSGPPSEMAASERRVAADRVIEAW
jgi:hypothetical protein